MKILFLQNTPIESFGTMYVSSILKQNDHYCDVLIESNINKILDYMKNKSFDIVAFSAMSFMHNWILDVSKKIKQDYRCKIIIGGPHATFYPEIINNWQVDFVCRGEGEYAMVELINKIEEDKPTNKIKNVWIKQNKTIYKNPLRNLIKDLDQLPFPDREIYYKKYHLLKNLNAKRFLSGRGCPFNCSFCHNPILKNLYRNKGDYIRQRSPENLIEEILLIKGKYRMKTISFSDDIFTQNKKWLNKFLNLYKMEVGIPFICNTHPHTISKKEIIHLKNSGCYGLMMGVETGNEELRKKVLNKNILNSQIMKTATLIKKHNMNLLTFNMLGLPGETLENAFETIKFNIKIKADYCYSGILQPFPKTKIVESAIKNNYLNSNFSLCNTINNQGVYFKSKYKKGMSNLNNMFYIAVKNPQLIPLVKHLIKLPSNKLFETIGVLSYGYNVMRFYRLGKLPALRFYLNSVL